MRPNAFKTPGPSLLLEPVTSFGKPNMTADAKEWIASMKLTLATPFCAVREAPLASGQLSRLYRAVSIAEQVVAKSTACKWTFAIH